MTNEEARNVIEKYLKCRNEPCNDVRLCSECGLNTNESEQDEAFKLAIEALKCMSLNADIINADAMHKLFITGEMTMEDFKKMCGDVKAIETLSCSEIPNSCHDGDKDINVPNTDKYEYHYDHTDCIWYRPEARNRCPSTCAQYRDGWNDAMNYIFRDGKGYRPYRRGEQYGE